MTTYQIVQGLDGEVLLMFKDGVESFVPMSLDNVDYQNYLESLNEPSKS